MIGHSEQENERVRSQAELLRMSTALLLNIQLAPKDRLAASELWPLPWDAERTDPAPSPGLTPEEYDQKQAEMSQLFDTLNINGRGTQ